MVALSGLLIPCLYSSSWQDNSFLMPFLKKEEKIQKSPAKRFLFILGLGMFALYFALGIAIMFWKDFPMDLSFGYRLAFGLLLIVYSFIRFIRLLRS